MLLNILFLYLCIGLFKSIHNAFNIYFKQEVWDEVMAKVPDADVVRLYLGTNLFVTIVITGSFLLTILIWPYEFKRR